MATEINTRKTAAPDGIVQEQGLCTSLAWDNYDENTETLSGLGTLHDTVEIATKMKLKNNSNKKYPKQNQKTSQNLKKLLH